MLSRQKPLIPSAVADGRTSLVLLLHVGVVVLGATLVVAPLTPLLDALGCLVILAGARLVSRDLVTEIGEPVRVDRREHPAS